MIKNPPPNPRKVGKDDPLADLDPARAEQSLPAGRGQRSARQSGNQRVRFAGRQAIFPRHRAPHHNANHRRAYGVDVDDARIHDALPDGEGHGGSPHGSQQVHDSGHDDCP